nr:Uncharacterised protein [Ipomoea batatas]
MFFSETHTFSNSISACPCGASSKPNTVSGRSIFIPGEFISTKIMDCCLCIGAVGSVFPCKMRSLHLGSMAPLVHHFFPLMIYESPSLFMEHSILVASEDATCGSVIAKPDRIFPSSKGISHSLICSAFPYRSNTSIFPVSGAPQLKTCGAQIERPIISQRYPYSRLESPAPNKQSYLLFDVVSLLSPKRSFLARAALSNCINKFQRPSLFASSFNFSSSG